MADEIRWGILGAASIAVKMCVAIEEAENATCVAVASRDKAKAEAFAKANCPSASPYGSYDELLEDERVQVVYIPLPTGMRTEWVLKCAAKRKHVLCEKPVAPTIREVDLMLEACRAAGVQFMDNTMLAHNERTESLCKVLQDQQLFGDPIHVNSTFSVPRAFQEVWMKNNIRVKQALEPQGCLGDLGWYCVRVSVLAFGGEDPEAVSCNFLEETSEGVPVHAAATLRFSGGRTAIFHCGYRLAFRQWVEVAGDKCTLWMDDMVIPSRADVWDYKIYQGSAGPKALTFPQERLRTEEFRGTQQHTALVQNMSAIVASGRLEEQWPRVSRQIQVLICALMMSARQNGSWVTLGSLQADSKL